MTEATRWIEERIADGRLKVADLAALVPFAQRQLGVDDDGKPGRRTFDAVAVTSKLAKIGGDQRVAPIPKNRRALERDPNYGKPSWERTSAGGRPVDLDDSWERRNIRRFRTHTGKSLRMHRLAGDEFVRLFAAACEASGYVPRYVQTYNPRTIGKSDRLSMHAYGIAVDFDGIDPPGDDCVGNPWGGVRKNGEPSLLRQHMAFVDVFEAAGWTWGGRWKDGKGDDMHFQRAGT